MSAKTFALKGADPQDASLRVLIVPHAGAGAASGGGFAEHAPDDWLVATARLPGRETRIRESVPDLPGLVDDVVATARALPGTAPLIVVGVCFGAVIGLEAVRALQREDTGRVTGMVAVSQWAVNEKPDPERRLLRDADDTDDTDDVLAILAGIGGVPETLAANEEMLKLVLPTIVADIRAVEDYSTGPDPLLRCPLLTVFGDEDPLCPEERTADWALFSENTRSVWLPGGHMLLTESPALVVDALVGNLDQFATEQS
ncbi:thioesterase II family protein [Streptomyces sp. NBC_00878]|uniref:thioesterase II family protein n=1 Tax=Streptomyces sp. NBC_00878 TaxID=2975854 RepID=UPI002258F2FE|nr:alpha/beta fold hydrolase [Streptomyces sp. NBC_00878]MCX4907726.1 alpha/beta fold hydrolase [Streptomyces sp. NBC_00878]